MNVTIPSGIDTLSDNLFFNCTSLNNISIPSSVTNIGSYTFGGTVLTNVTIPNSVTSIGSSAFVSCWALHRVTIGNSVVSIGGSAFYGCIGLTNAILIHQSVTNIGPGPFGGVPALITVDPQNAYYSSLNGVLFNKDQSTLVECPSTEVGSYMVPDSVTDIAGLAFVSCNGLTSIDVPNSVSSLGKSAFAFCTALSRVYFRGSAPSSGDVLFGYNNPIVYYLPETTRWGSSFGGRPTTLWNSQVETGSVSLGEQRNRFGFTIAGTSGMVVVVDATTNLADPIWVPVATNTLTDGSFYFSDPQWTHYSRRFYGFSPP
jgi:BspA type Leucine rich repeat region (6 copies)